MRSPGEQGLRLSCRSAESFHEITGTLAGGDRGRFGGFWLSAEAAALESANSFLERRSSVRSAGRARESVPGWISSVGRLAISGAAFVPALSQCTRLRGGLLLVNKSLYRSSETFGVHAMKVRRKG